MSHQQPPVRRAHRKGNRGDNNTPANDVAFARLQRQADNVKRRKPPVTQIGQTPGAFSADDAVPSVTTSNWGY